MMVLFQRKIIYMGNAGNPLHRIPKFRLLAGKLIVDNLEREVQVIAVAPRSYWTSTKTSPSEAGFLSDYTAVLEWISNAYPNSPVVLYGHSIGGSIAVKLLASLPASTRVRGLVVENAFTSVPAMVRTVYPSKWLPYYYLGPLVFDKWDALSTLSHERSSALRNVILHPPSILIINSENDELVPAEMGREMFDAASFVYHGLSKPLGTGPRRVLIPGALHDDAFTKRQWKDEMRAYLTKVATVDTYRQLGTNGIKPHDIMALFISLAYIAIALDATGLLRFLAFWVVRKGGSSGPRLYLLLQDPIILSGTAFLAYLTRVAGIAPPTAWIFAQFCAANIASAVLVSSNPTNLVVAGGFEISFLVFTANLVLPVFASAIAVYPVLRWYLFRSEGLIPASISAQDLDPQAALVDSHGAIFGSTLMITTLLVLVGTSAGGLHVEVWMITVPAAIIMFLRDVSHDIHAHRRKSEIKSRSNPLFSASLAGLLWRDILRQKGIIVKRSEFAKLNLALIFVSMLVGCSVLIAQIYVRPPT
ncbi:alpha/beta hydrolase family protein, partial [Rhizoctonia solani AG-3 Rhs1AP]